MASTLTLSEIVRIEKLLALLEPGPVTVCRVPGCVHAHDTSTRREGATALAA
jgi:hypothetical protein